MSEQTMFEELENKPPEKRTSLEQCIVDAARLEDMRDGEYEQIEMAADELEELRARVAKLEAELQFFRATFPRAASNYAKAAALRGE